MNRRQLLAGLLGLGAGIVLPEPPRVRAYSFLSGERLRTVSNRWGADELIYVPAGVELPTWNNRVLFLPVGAALVSYMRGELSP